ncbi:CoA transferase [Prescottella equi]|uniref:CoA transferase n=1 Tax=Rhodococcus hoagii TaxID=43767 RepID=UPI0020C66922|nr:CoA transferase [Prescottella equi]
MALTGLVDAPPRIPQGCAASVARELSDWIAAATAETAHPVQVDGAQLLAERAAYTGGVRGGRVSVGRHCRLLRTADGWAAVSNARPDDPSLLGALVGRDIGNNPWQEVGAWLHTHTGADLAERAELLGLAAAPILTETVPMAVPTAARPRSVEGLLVVDFSALWAGPLCAHLLGTAGARVVKVETPNRLDGARFGDRRFYDLLHAGHESVVLDPSTVVGREAMRRLVAAADIVIESSRPHALKRFGLDAESVCATGTTWISITARGRASNTVGFGDDVAASSGLVAADETGAPVFVGDAIADPLTGLTAAVCALTTSSNSAGRLWDVSMASVVAATLGEAASEQPPVYRLGDRWMVTAESGEVEVVGPRRRAGAHGRAADPGRDTKEVLRSLGMPG